VNSIDREESWWQTRRKYRQK